MFHLGYPAVALSDQDLLLRMRCSEQADCSQLSMSIDMAQQSEAKQGRNNMIWQQQFTKHYYY